MDPLAGKEVHDRQEQDRADPRRNEDEGDQHRQHHGIVVPGGMGHDAVGHQHRAAQEHEAPTAEQHGVLEFMLEDPLFVDRQREQVGDLAAAEQRTVEDHARGEDQHQEQGEEERVEDGLHEVFVNPQRSVAFMKWKPSRTRWNRPSHNRTLKTITSA